MPVPAGRPVSEFQTVWNRTPAVSHQSPRPSAGARSSTARTVGSAVTISRKRPSPATASRDESVSFVHLVDDGSLVQVLGRESHLTRQAPVDVEVRQLEILDRVL